MKFTALKITEGDSFLLQNNERNILFDTGKSKSECRIQLQIKQISHLDIVIISHFDLDHVNGLIELLKSNIEITEIWLPDNFGRIQASLNKKKYGILNLIKEYEGRLFNDDDHADQLEFNEQEDSIESRSYFHELQIKPFALIDFQLTNYLKGKQLTNIENIVNECNKAKVIIKWLKYTGIFNSFQISNEMVGLNCIENTNITAYSDDLEALYFLSRINQESLVLKFCMNDLPEILFTADSGFEFLNPNQRIKLKDFSIMTAPHHGSNNSENGKGYSLVKGRKLTYVRSNNSRVTTISVKFTHHIDSYCTICRNAKSVLEEVVLTYSGKWNPNKGACKCI